jgi:hypothetical protein
MNKPKLLKVWNALLGLALVGVLIAIGLAKATGNGAFYELHETMGIIFAILAAGHVVLNWGWVRSALVGKAKTKR